MVKVSPESALDEAKCVRAKDVIGVAGTLVQVWYGGTMVRVFGVFDGQFDEFEPWSVSDEKGRPVDREEIAKLMEQHEAIIVEEAQG